MIYKSCVSTNPSKHPNLVKGPSNLQHPLDDTCLREYVSLKPVLEKTHGSGAINQAESIITTISSTFYLPKMHISSRDEKGIQGRISRWDQRQLA
ncbi:hypothetical protein Scep_017029 [Stephania cephalantha]|uniref:Uncharacterized protein n=1 Tax=Stephania cephalantha TaxID=152367 RepID=A0AAP0IQK5_9MAGN